MKSPNSRSFSTSARAQQEGSEFHNSNNPSAAGSGAGANPDVSAAVVANMISQAVEEKAEELEAAGLKFPVSQTKLPRTENFRTRYDSILEQFTKQLMHDGKLSKAQKVCYITSPMVMGKIRKVKS